MTKDQLKALRNRLKEANNEVGEPVEPLVGEDDDEDNSGFVGFNLNDKYFIDLYCQENPEAAVFFKMLDELNVFKEGEEYDVLKDMRDGYQKSLKKSMHDRLFDLLPDHVFWDIKVQ